MTLQSPINYWKAGRLSDVLTIHGECVHSGRTTRVVDVDITNQDGVNVCKATFTMFVTGGEMNPHKYAFKIIFLIFMEPWSTSKPMSQVQFYGIPWLRFTNPTGQATQEKVCACVIESWCNKPKKTWPRKTSYLS